MNPGVLTLVQTFAPILAEALGALIAALAGRAPDDAIAVASEIVAGVDRDHPDWPSGERHATAHAAIAAYLGDEVSTVTVNVVLELALVRVRQQRSGR